jgi:hypothetical protein
MRRRASESDVKSALHPAGEMALFVELRGTIGAAQ